jgi:hypothetical protein
VKFVVAADGFAGYEFDLLDQDSLLWVEADAVERVTGVTMGQLGSEVSGKASVVLAFFWVSVKRQLPQTTFAALQQLPMGAFRILADDELDEVEPDPTGAPEGGAPELTDMSNDVDTSVSSLTS